MKLISIIVLMVCILSCTSQKDIQSVQCSKFYKNDFKKIQYGNYKTIFKQDTLSINEIRFECVYSTHYTQKIMYDKFGKWDKEIFPSNNLRFPILIWNHVDLFSNGKLYMVLTYGVESWKSMYAAVMVFDENENDLLSDSSDEKESLTNFFADLIKSNKTENKDFFRVYNNIESPKR